MSSSTGPILPLTAPQPTGEAAGLQQSPSSAPADAPTGAPPASAAQKPTTPADKSAKVIKVDYLARVEGEGGIHIRVRGGKVEDVKLRIFEPPRFFEAFLRDRSYTEAPDITARICGICPVAYQMSAVHAMEDAFGATITPTIRLLRRLLYTGEWIESHVLHVFMLHAPDFLGYHDVVALSKAHPELVQKALKLKKTGNEIVRTVGGREIHPINVRVGGFYRLPNREELLKLKQPLLEARAIAEEAVRFSATLPFPDFEQDYTLVALRHEHEYAFNEGRLVSNRGLDLDVHEYLSSFFEEHVEHSTALHSLLNRHTPYLVGPLARFALSYDKLPGHIQALAEEVGLQPTTRNPFKSIVVRAIETLYAVDEALRIVDCYVPEGPASVPVQVKAGTGHATTEAPRGILYHRYIVDDAGKIRDARIVPPTSQNLRRIEEDLRAYVAPRWQLPPDQLTWQCEQAVRNYDPCISCSTHFLKLTLEES